jgi:glycosyltransferase involved in cell wall biosynthesis
MELQSAPELFAHALPLDVSIVMACHNHAHALPHSIANAFDALDRIARFHGLAGEVVIADHGSTDGSRAIATALGARVVPVARNGYGAAIRCGLDAAMGRYLIIGDGDGRHDLVDAVPMIERLMHGADLCVGSRTKGGVAPGAMGWTSRYVTKPLLTAILRVWVRAAIDDPGCHLRAIRKDRYAQLQLTSEGEGLAGEMVAKAARSNFAIGEVPATLWPARHTHARHTV